MAHRASSATLFRAAQPRSSPASMPGPGRTGTPHCQTPRSFNPTKHAYQPKAQPSLDTQDERRSAVTVAGRELLASASDDRTVRIWDPGTGERYATLQGHPGWLNDVCAVTVPGRQLLASADSHGMILIWDPGTGEQRAAWHCHQGQSRGVCAVTVAGRGLLASAGEDGTVRIWDPGTGEQRAALEGHQRKIRGVCAATVAGRQLLASASDDSTVRIWDPQTEACLLIVPTYHPACSVAWVAGSLAIGLTTGILVIQPNAAV